MSIEGFLEVDASVEVSIDMRLLFEDCNVLVLMLIFLLSAISSTIGLFRPSNCEEDEGLDEVDEDEGGLEAACLSFSIRSCSNRLSSLNTLIIGLVYTCNGCNTIASVPKLLFFSFFDSHKLHKLLLNRVLLYMR